MMEQNRKTICRKHKLNFIKAFDTNEKEPHKDVFLAEDINGKKVVVRTGEHRSLNFLYNGYKGKYFQIPKLVYLDQEFPYEIEEYLEGKLLYDIARPPKAKKFLDQDLQEKLLKAYFEFQELGPHLHLEKIWKKKEKLGTHFEKSKGLIIEKEKAKEIIYNDDYDEFWQVKYPGKWKFSLDNLILTKDKKIGFIDLPRVGLYYWGHDLGWLFWPMWFGFENNQLKKAKKHAKALQKFFELAYEYAPAHDKMNKEKFYKRCWLIVFERIIGAFFDVAEKIPHAKNIYEDPKRKELFIKFLNDLLEITLKKI